jgi:hypothetical protein
MEGPISFRGYKEQESNLILPEHDDDDDDDDDYDIKAQRLSWFGHDLYFRTVHVVIFIFIQTNSCTIFKTHSHLKH